MIRSVFVVVSLFFCVVAIAQEFGGNPPSLKWKQINTPATRVIFPAGLDKQAARVADISQYLNRTTANTIGDHTRKIDIVLQNQTTLSNGYVQLGPWRSEFFLTPLQNSLRLGSLSWVDQLALHEYRHVQQYMNFRKGLSNLAYIIAGEEGQVLANSTAVPDWFFEGDAVYQETAISEQGRGRLPAFFSEYRSLWQANRTFSYMKLRNGSFKHLVPDHYSLGYLLVAYGREKYGADIWKKVSADAVRFKPLFYPFQGALKRHTGVPFSQFVDSAFSFYRNYPQYKEEDVSTALTPISERYVSDYAFPYPVGGDSLLVYRRTGRHLPGFYLLHEGREQRLAVKDISADDQFSYQGGKLVYSSYDPDIRWGWRNYGEIIMLDIRTGNRRNITNRTKYFSPDISHDGTSIAAIDVDPSGRSSLHVINAQDGKAESVLSDSSQFFSQPRFSNDDRHIFLMVRSAEGQMSLHKFDRQQKIASQLFPFTWQAISFPYVKGDSVFFTANRSGQDKLMVWDDRRQVLLEATSRYAGIQQAAPMGNDSIVFTGISAWGSRVFRAKLEAMPISMEQWTTTGNDMYLNNSLSEGTSGLKAVEPNRYDVGRYRGTTGFFNFHSWRPYYEQPEWSMTLYGNNVLNTFRSSLYYAYNENEGYHQLGYNGSYAAWFPWITGGMSYTFDRTATRNNRQFRWNELNANIGLSVPLNFTGGRTYSFLTLTSLFNTQQLYFKELPKSADNGINFMDNRLDWRVQIQKAPQHIFPRFAHTLSVRHRGSTSSLEARQLLLSSFLYLPGVMRNHNLVIAAAYQARDTAGQYFFSNNFPLSRGYPDLNFPRMWKWAANYHFPVMYPDWGFAQVVYFMRIRGNVFYDQSFMKSLRTGRTTGLASTGVELFFDTKWWNQQEVSFGIRYSRLLDTDLFALPPNPNQFEFILPVNLIPR
jgi:hypothetical protein